MKVLSIPVKVEFAGGSDVAFLLQFDGNVKMKSAVFVCFLSNDHASDILAGKRFMKKLADN